MENFGNRFYFIGSDYVYPKVSNKIMREFVRTNGGSVVGEKYLNLRATPKDFVSVMRDIKNMQPDVIFSTIVGESTSMLYQAYNDYGFDPKVMPIASLTTTEAEISDMGFDVGEGHITAAPYFDGLEGEASSTFSARYKKRYGADEPTNMCLEAAYFQVHMFAKALEETNSMETEILRPAVLGLEHDAPQGRISINQNCNHADLWTRIGKANRRGRFDILFESNSRVSADPYLIGYGRRIAFDGV